MTDLTSWLFAGLLLVGLVSLVVLFQDRFIYFPVRYSTAQLEAARSVGVQEVKYQTCQGNQAAFFFLHEHCETTPESLWLVFGGNGDLALEWLGMVRSFPGSRTGFLLIDYPGYGVWDGRLNPRTPQKNLECGSPLLLVQQQWKLE